MNRLRQAQCEVLGAATQLVPRRLRQMVECDMFAADPIFAGICTHEWSNEDASLGRSYRTVAHVCFPEHVRDRRLTVVLPKPYGLVDVLHELGHVLHWNLQNRAGGWESLPEFEEVSDYAATNQLEAFAEAWVAWFYPARQVDLDPYWNRWSRPNDEFFDRLAAGL